MKSITVSSTIRLCGNFNLKKIGANLSKYSDKCETYTAYYNVEETMQRKSSCKDALLKIVNIMNSNRRKLCQPLVEFLEIAIICVLKLKHIYPNEIFMPKQKYGNVVYEILHPELKEYVMNCMEAVHHFAMEDQLSKVVVCFFDNSYEILKERIIFDITSIKNMIHKDTFLINLEKTFRSFFINLNLFSGQFEQSGPLNELSFLLQIYTTESNVTPFLNKYSNKDFPWVQHLCKYKRISTSEVITVGIEENDFINMQIYIEKLC